MLTAARGPARIERPAPLMPPQPDRDDVGKTVDRTDGWIVLIAPDSFKGSLTSVEVARAIATGWSRARPRDTIVLSPLADGGEGTLAAIEAAGGWTRMTARVRDPLARSISAAYLRSDDGRRAMVEMAEASGLSRVAPDEREPVQATSAGTGDLLRAAIEAGATDIVLGIGGSATTDGGRGLIDALEAVDGALPDVRLEVACDVSNPLLGPTGAAAVYGPQKGATPELVAALDARNASWADALEAATGRRERETPGAGAAGGVGFGLLCLTNHFASLRLQAGIDLVMDAAGFHQALQTADLVITGEGRIDAQTAFGKTALGVARRAETAGVPCVAVGGSVTQEGVEALATVGARAVAASELTLDEAIAAGAAPLIETGERLARELT